jgi:hypothetical protein
MNTQYTTQTVEYHKCNPFVFTNKINNDNSQTLETWNLVCIKKMKQLQHL